MYVLMYLILVGVMYLLPMYLSLRPRFKSIIEQRYGGWWHGQPATVATTVSSTFLGQFRQMSIRLFEQNGRLENEMEC